MTELAYHGRAMKFEPTRILCLQAFGPLDGDEPEGADILGLLGDGYTVFVELQPGDGTRYGLLLTGAPGRFSVMRVGGHSTGAITVEREVLTTAAMCEPLAPFNTWSQEFFAWWVNKLLSKARGAMRDEKCRCGAGVPCLCPEEREDD